MLPVLSREQQRAFDRRAIEACQVPGLVLMENAGRNAADVIRAELGARGGSVAIVCGPGNNGGDGFVVARHLLARGVPVWVGLLGSAGSLKGDARAHHAAWLGVGGAVHELGGASVDWPIELDRAGVVVDALFGTGLDRALTGSAERVVAAINRASARKVALDVPSGLDANTGQALGSAVRADVTVTFAFYKPGLLTTSGAEHAGRVVVVDIGVPSAGFEAVGRVGWLLESADVARQLPRRGLAMHKGTAGRVVVFAGSPGKTGAALLVARGALRAGAGLVTIATFAEAADALDRRVLEEMTARIDASDLAGTVEPWLASASSVAIGPGLGHTVEARALVDRVVLEWAGVKVVDADALTHFQGRAHELAGARGSLILTPHPAELGRLLGTSAEAVERDRFGALAAAVELTSAVVLLKGPRTLIGAPERAPVVNGSGTPALATGGAGDVLAGLTAALAAQLPPFEAAYVAAHVHGVAAERWSSQRAGADRGLLAHEVADCVPEVLAALSGEHAVLTV